MNNAEINQITEKIIGAAIEVHRALGPGLLESAYEACLVYELNENLQRTSSYYLGDPEEIKKAAEAVAKHRAHLEESGGWQRVERVRLPSELDMLLQEALVACWRSKVPEKVYLEVVDRLVERSISPHQAVEKLAPCMSQG